MNQSANLDTDSKRKLRWIAVGFIGAFALSILTVIYTGLNVEGVLGEFDAGSVITPDDLRTRGLAKKRGPIKILGEGEIDRALTVHAHSFSLGAVEKIKAAGGSVEVVGK